MGFGNGEGGFEVGGVVVVSGITQLTGDVVAGPGSGSVADTLVATTNVTNIIVNAILNGELFFAAQAPAYGATGNGTTDDTEALTACFNAAITAGRGIIWLGTTTVSYKVSSQLPKIQIPSISIIGAGIDQCMIQPTSALAVAPLYIHTSPFSATLPFVAGTFAGFTIDGTNTQTAGIAGLDYGDIVGARLEIAAQNFRGTNGIGIYFNNLTGWCEDNSIRVSVSNNTVGCVFTVNGGYNSYGYCDIDIFINPGGGLYNNQIGIQIYTSALIYHGKFTVRGGVQGTNCIGLETINVGTTYGGLVAELFDIVIEVETNASGIVPIQLGSYTSFSGSGVVDTGYGNYTANSTVSWQGGVIFTGYWGVQGFTPGGGMFTTEAGVNNMASGTNTAQAATVTSPTFVSGNSQQLNTTQDVELYVEVTTANSVTISMGSSSAANALTPVTAVAAPIGAFYNIRVPAGWYVKITATIADLNVNAVAC